MTKRARSVVAAATSAEMPGFIKPQLATLKASAPKGDQWLHEIKFDGYRVQVHLNRQEEGLHPQWAGLDQTVFPNRWRAGYSRSGNHRRGSRGREGRENQ